MWHHVGGTVDAVTLNTEERRRWQGVLRMNDIDVESINAFLQRRDSCVDNPSFRARHAALIDTYQHTLRGYNDDQRSDRSSSAGIDRY